MKRYSHLLPLVIIIKVFREWWNGKGYITPFLPKMDLILVMERKRGAFEDGVLHALSQPPHPPTPVLVALSAVDLVTEVGITINACFGVRATLYLSFSKFLAKDCIVVAFTAKDVITLASSSLALLADNDDILWLPE